MRYYIMGTIVVVVAIFIIAACAAFVKSHPKSPYDKPVEQVEHLAEEVAEEEVIGPLH
jgi:hypothetical protein